VGVANHLGQLVDVARPRIARQSVQRLGAKALSLNAATGVLVLQQCLGYQGNIFAPLGQRRQLDDQRCQPPGNCFSRVRASSIIRACMT